LQNVGLSDIPLWALNADYNFYQRKLEIAHEREKNGLPAHKKYASYESRLQQKLAQIDSEIERRKERGKLAELP
jgi:hypothetical protein